MPTALVTGANGFIGGHLVRLLIDRGYTVRALVRPTSDLRSLEGVAATLFVGDIREPESLIEAVRGVEYIFHLAAELMVTSRKDFFDAIAIGTENMLQCAKQHAGGSLKRFLLVSSQAAAGPGRDKTALNEEAPMEPISWYGSSKKKAEEAAMSLKDEIPVTIVRPPAVYGPRDTDVSQIYPVVENHVHPLLGLRSKYLTAVYVEDLVDGMVRAAESPNSVGQKYFLTHNELVTGHGLVRTVAKAMDKPFGIPLPAPTFLLRLAAPFVELVYHFTRQRPTLTRDKAREVSQRFWVADASKAKRDFGWQAQHNLLEGMRKTIPYYRDLTVRERIMAEESLVVRWLKFIICAALVGAVIEFASAAFDLYDYNNWWAVFIIVIVGFGVGLGSIAHWLRKTPWPLRAIIGLVLVAAFEILNYNNMIESIGWEFNPAKFMGPLNPLLRAVIVGLIGSVIILASTALMRLSYRQRLRFG